MIVAVLSDKPELRERFCAMVGREMSRDDIRFYAADAAGRTVHLVEPTAYPEKIQPLLYSLSMADHAVLLVESLTPKIGEIIVALDAMGLESGTVVSSAPLPLKGTVLDKYQTVADMGSAAQRVLALQPAAGGEALIALAHRSEAVKSAGNTMHGTVRSGKLSKSDKLFLLPDRKDIEVRSLKADGKEADEAQAGSSIEMAYKGDLFERGIIVPIRHEHQVESVINGRFMKSPFYKDELKGKIHAYTNLQYVEGVVNENDLTLSAPLAYEKGEGILVVDASNQKLRIAGVFRSKW
jgi:selenocysteine-specific translation elongation factor